MIATPIQQIDHILAVLRNHASYLNATELIDKINNSEIVIEPSAIHRILEKLERDKFVFVITDKDETEYYSISFEGDLFIGYKKQQILDNETIEALSISKQEARDYSNRLLLATWCAGIAAVLLLLWQVFLYLYPHQYDWWYFWFQTIPKESLNSNHGLTGI
jgi:Fe2+ or Zn2+ uptake regulation protein